MTAPEIRPPAPPDQIVIPVTDPNPVPEVDDLLDAAGDLTPVTPGDAFAGAIQIVSTNNGSPTDIAGPYGETDAQVSSGAKTAAS